MNEVYNRQDNSGRPPPRRVETDPAVWQGEATVRTIQDPTIPYANNHHGPGTPPQRWRGREDMPHPSPYANQFNHSDSHLDNSEHSQRRDWRNSAWRQQGGGLGVSNNT